VEETVVKWRPDGELIGVETERGQYTASRMIMCAGAGMAGWLNDAGLAATVTRQPLFWFRPGRNGASLKTVWAIQIDDERLLYGFPDVGNGLKAAIHYGGTQTTWLTVDRNVSETEASEVVELCGRYLPGVHGDLVRGATCLYTNTPDLHFVIDAHPQYENVLIVSACSGHGFKFASAIGEAASQWAANTERQLDLSLFSFDRLRPHP
jgi:sarcosine oxidase